MALEEKVLAQAVAWAVRTGDPSFTDWEGFTQWLETDPRHGDAYNLVSASVMDAADGLPVTPQVSAPQVANDDGPVPLFRRRWFSGALAASLVAVLALGYWQIGGGRYSIETVPGEMRSVALGNGDVITLGGGTRITLDHDDLRYATLDHGQALFTIRHDEARPFRLDVGEDHLVDLGTVFDVRHDGREMSVAVSEGAVAFNPRKQNVRIDPGKVLTSAQGSDEYRLAAIPAAQVGEWREGRLSFQNASLSSVADDLSRATGLKFAAAAGGPARRVSGSLLVAPVARDPRSAGPLLGVEVRPSGDGWTLEVR